MFWKSASWRISIFMLSTHPTDPIHHITSKVLTSITPTPPPPSPASVHIQPLHQASHQRWNRNQEHRGEGPRHCRHRRHVVWDTRPEEAADGTQECHWGHLCSPAEANRSWEDQKWPTTDRHHRATNKDRLPEQRTESSQPCCSESWNDWTKDWTKD